MIFSVFVAKMGLN
jgi:transposase